MLIRGVLVLTIFFVQLNLSASDAYIRLNVRVFPLYGTPKTYSCALSRQHTFDDLLDSFADIYPQFIERKEYMSLLIFPYVYNIRELLLNKDGSSLADAVIHLVEHKKVREKHTLT